MKIKTKKRIQSVHKIGNNTQKVIIHDVDYHPLIDKVMKEFQKILKDREKAPKKGKDRIVHYKAGEYYVVTCFRALNSLLDRTRQVEEALKFLEKKPSDKILERYKMSHQEYFEYHHNTLLAYYTSYSECLYQIINAVLNLGLAEKHVSYPILDSHKWIRDTNLSSEIKALEKLRSLHASDRNQAIHQGRAKTIDKLQTFFSLDYFAEMAFPDEDLKEVIKFHKKTRRLTFTWTAKEVLGPMKVNFEEMEKNGIKILDKLIPYFEFWTTRGKPMSSLPCSTGPA